MIFTVKLEIWKSFKLKTDLSDIFYTVTPRRLAQPIYTLYGLLNNGNIIKTVYQGKDATDTAIFIAWNINHWNLKRADKVYPENREGGFR